MSKITPLMTSLHEGHITEERLKCIDNMLFNKCEDTKHTILQAFWWYRKYTKAKLQKLEKIEQIVNCELIAGKRNYQSCYTAFYEIVDVIQDRKE